MPWTREKTSDNQEVWSKPNGARAIYWPLRQSFVAVRAGGKAVTCSCHGALAIFKSADDAMEAADADPAPLRIAGVPMGSRRVAR